MQGVHQDKRTMRPHHESSLPSPGEAEAKRKAFIEELLKVNLSEEEEKLIEDIEPHLPPEIKELSPRVKRAYLIQNVLNLRDSSTEKLLQRLKEFKPKNEKLYNFKHWEFDERFIALTKQECPADSKYFEEVIPGVYRFPMVDSKFASQLLAEVDHFEKWCFENNVEVSRPNSMNNYGAILDHFGFHQALSDLIDAFINPLALKLYPHMKPLNGGHHGFIVSYQVGKDEKLDFHRDDSEVTLNLCLGRDFKGGELYFGGVRCRKHQQVPPVQGKEGHKIGHNVGYGLLHLGAHRHAATKIESGRRENLILWCRSDTCRAKFQDASCGSFCGVFKRGTKQIES